MAIDLTNVLVIGVSSTALFDLNIEDELFRREGLAAYKTHQVENEKVVLKPGVAFPLVKAILKLNSRFPDSPRKTEVVIMSRNSTETSLRIFNSIKEYGLDITRAALTGGAPLSPYLKAFSVSLFLSQDEQDVELALDAGFPAAIIYPPPGSLTQDIDQIRVAFDGDAVLFSEESEAIYQEHGLQAFHNHESANAEIPLLDGPFAKLLRTLALIQAEYKNEPISPIRTALVTARSSPAHERAIRTLRAWDVSIDEAFFLGGLLKGEVLKAFGPHMFFDDHKGYCDDAAVYVPTSRVPAKVRKLQVV